MFIVLFANEVKILNVKTSKESTGSYIFTVTLLHNDSSWTHYADSWSVLDADKKLISKRVLWHPHENEQPFTRSKNGIKIPQDTNFVYIGAHDKVHGFSKQLYKYDLK